MNEKKELALWTLLTVIVIWVCAILVDRISAPFYWAIWSSLGVAMFGRICWHFKD